MCSFFFVKQKTAYDMRISDWSSDVCSSDLARRLTAIGPGGEEVPARAAARLGIGGDDLHPRLHQVAPVPDSLRIAAAHEKDDRRGIGRARSEERRVGKECVSTCRSGWSPYH